MGENSHAAGWGEGVAEIRHFIRKAFIKRFVLDSQESRKFSKIEIRNEATIDVHGYAVTMTIVIEAVSVCGSVTSSCDSVASAKKKHIGVGFCVARTISMGRCESLCGWDEQR